jgi:predicted nucleic acid-binding protein
LILADTSAWVEFLRATGHPVHHRLRTLIREDRVAITEVVVMELLAGARPGSELHELRSRLVALPILPLDGLADFEEAALLYRLCRAGGETVRDLRDCLIAAVAIREGASVLHNDSDFDVLGRHTGLRIEPVAAT